MAQGYANPDALVTTDWVAEHAKDPNVRVLESNEDVLLYDIGHVPGAQKLDWQADLNDPVTRDFIGPEAFAESEVLEIEGEVDGKALAVRPVVRGPMPDRAVAIAAVARQRRRTCIPGRLPHAALAPFMLAAGTDAAPSSDRPARARRISALSFHTSIRTILP